MNLVLTNHKYSQRNTNLEIKFCHRCENVLQSEDQEIRCFEKNYGFRQKKYGNPVINTTNFHI